MKRSAEDVRIRAITVGIDPDGKDPLDLVPRLTRLLEFAEEHYSQEGFEVQTRRLTIPPVMPGDASVCYGFKSKADSLSRIAEQAGIRWLCLPIFCRQGWSEDDLVSTVTGIIHYNPRAFVHFIIGEDGCIYDGSVAMAARSILSVSRLSQNGFDNFRLGVGANIRPNTPFFPFSYHAGREGFSLAVEIIGLLLDEVEAHPQMPLSQMRELLIDNVVRVIRRIDDVALDIETNTDFEYKGMDISIAPFPDGRRSVASLIEKLGPEHTGHAGTLTATALLTDVIKTALQRSGVRNTGFNGVMFSPLEDGRLANANNQRHLSIEKLLCYSTVCGCGIDMVPLPGDVFTEELSSLILDVATLSTVLNKPLGVRVLPIPLKTVNELTNFNHDFLTNTRVMGVGGQGLQRALSEMGNFSFLRFQTDKSKELIR
jgi:uncharacterized protein